MVKKTSRCDFTRGWAACAAAVAKEDGYVGNGIVLLKMGGFQVEKLAEAGCEDYDLEGIRKDLKKFLVKNK